MPTCFSLMNCLMLETWRGERDFCSYQRRIVVCSSTSNVTSASITHLLEVAVSVGRLRSAVVRFIFTPTQPHTCPHRARRRTHAPADSIMHAVYSPHLFHLDRRCQSCRVSRGRMPAAVSALLRQRQQQHYHVAMEDLLSPSASGLAPASSAQAWHVHARGPVLLALAVWLASRVAAMVRSPGGGAPEEEEQLPAPGQQWAAVSPAQRWTETYLGRGSVQLSGEANAALLPVRFRAVKRSHRNGGQGTEFLYRNRLFLLYCADREHFPGVVLLRGHPGRRLSP